MLRWTNYFSSCTLQSLKDKNLTTHRSAAKRWKSCWKICKRHSIWTKNTRSPKLKGTMIILWKTYIHQVVSKNLCLISISLTSDVTHFNDTNIISQNLKSNGWKFWITISAIQNGLSLIKLLSHSWKPPKVMVLEAQRSAKLRQQSRDVVTRWWQDFSDAPFRSHLRLRVHR